MGLSLSDSYPDIAIALLEDAMKDVPLQGTIRTQKKCPLCRNRFTPVHGKSGVLIGLICPEHRTSPDRFYLDLHHHGERYLIFSDRKGRILDSFSFVLYVQREISREIQERTFDPSKYVKRKQQEFWVCELLDRFKEFKEPEIAPSYWKDYLRMIGLARDFFGTADVREIRKMDLIRYKEELEAHRTYSPKSLKNALDHFRVFLRYCWKTLEIIDRVPQFPEIQLDEPKFKWLDQDNQLAIFDHVPEGDRPIIAFLMLQGIRPGEARALKIRDIDLAKQTVTIGATFSGSVYREKRKGRSSRTVTLPIHPEMMEFVSRSAKEALPEAFLFICPKTGRHYSETGLKRVWDEVRKAAGIYRDLRLYDATRHSFASQLVNAGVDIASVSRLLGHSTLKMTMRYAHHEVGKLRTDLERLSLKKVERIKTVSEPKVAENRLKKSK